jgi:hypothetical protein
MLLVELTGLEQLGVVLSFLMCRDVAAIIKSSGTLHWIRVRLSKLVGSVKSLFLGLPSPNQSLLSKLIFLGFLSPF